MEITLASPREFSFKRTIISHGWCQLLPFKIDEEKWQLTRTLELEDAKPVTITISCNQAGTHSHHVSPAQPGCCKKSGR